MCAFGRLVRCAIAVRVTVASVSKFDPQIVGLSTVKFAKALIDDLYRTAVSYMRI